MTPCRLRVTLATLIGATIMKFALPAEACSPPFCSAPLRLPELQRIPGNLAHFEVLSVDPGPLVLRTAEGEPIAASIRTIGTDRVFAPEQPIAPNTSVVLEYATRCGTELQPGSFEFLATEHGTLELQPAVLQVVERGNTYSSSERETSFARVRYQAPDANGYAATLMRHTFTVGGAEVGLSEVNGEPLIELSTSCTTLESENLIDTCGRVYRVQPGIHTVVATTHVLGSQQQPDPAHLQVEVRCAPDSSDAAETDGAELQGEQDGEYVTLQPVTSAQADDGAFIARRDGGSGCALVAGAARRSSALGLGLPALLLATVLLARRRSARA